ncbi:MAG: polysaccharide biosynthesis C-terminal domain-containing protein, partial [Halobacteriota archaeon]
HNTQALQQMINTTLKYNACVLLPTTLGIAFFAREIVVFLFTNAYLAAVLPLQTLLVGVAIFGTSMPVGGALLGAGRPDLGLKLVAVAACLNVVLNIVLVPLVGIEGAAATSALTYSLTGIVLVYLIVRVLNVSFDIRWYRNLAAVTLLVILFFELFEFLNERLALVILLVVYTLIVWFVFLSKSDRQNLFHIFEPDFVARRRAR